jgi:hypothetical protein
MLCIVLVLCIVAPASTSAGIITVSEFVGDASEGLESFGTGTDLIQTMSLSVFGGEATVSGPSAVSVAILNNVTSSHTAVARSGDRMLVANSATLTWEFAAPLNRFGGWFGTVSNTPGSIARFYDAGDTLVATLNVVSPVGGGWTWNGWQSTTGNDIYKVIITSNAIFGGTTYDDLQIARATPVSALPEPTSLLAWSAFGLLGLFTRFVKRRTT